ncbi:MAG: cytochrome P450 [Gemmataceae bacterium]|nr:cytochrome P450 [Gemmataceae bacterium]
MTVATRRPPGPKGTWFGGNLSEFRRARLDFFTRCAREYGDFVSLRFGPHRIILVNDPAAIDYVLVGGARSFRKHFALRLNPLLLGNGLLTSEGDFWLRQRRLAQPAFRASRMPAYAESFVGFTQRMLQRWQPGQSVDVLTEMERLTLDIAAKTLFDADVESEARAVGEALRVAQDAFVARFGSALPLPLSWPTPRNLALRRAVHRLDDIVYGIIHQRRRGGEDKGDLLSMLLAAQEEDGERMTDRQLRDECMTLFLAGHETTALTLSWAWYGLSRNAEAEAELAAEVQSVLGGRIPTLADLPRLKFTEMTVLEALRLYPPAYTFGREAIEDCEVGGYPVPKGMTILMSQWVMHRDPRFFAEPLEFRPNRWADGLLHKLPKLVYFPFGAGPRLCIGEKFAMAEAILVLATIAQKYRFTVVPEHPVVPAATFTLRPRNGVKAVLTER